MGQTQRHLPGAHRPLGPRSVPVRMPGQRVSEGALSGRAAKDLDGLAQWEVEAGFPTEVSDSQPTARKCHSCQQLELNI